MSSESEKQWAGRKPKMQIHLSDLVSTAIILAAIFGFYTTLRQFERGHMYLVFPSHVVLAIAVLLGASSQSSNRRSEPQERLFHLIRSQLIAGAICVVLSVSIVELAYGGFRHATFIPGAEATVAIFESEEIYIRTDYDKDGVKEYAPSLQNLLETTPGACDLLLVDPSLAAAEGLPMSTPTPKAGFCFVILKSQGANAKGGAKSYVDDNGNMTGGFAVLAYPASYSPAADLHQRCCYMIGPDRFIYMRDFGTATLAIVPTITTFDPDTNWVPCE